MQSSRVSVSVVIPNWSRKQDLSECLRSLLAQTQKSHIIVVDNGSTDGSVIMLRHDFPDVEVIALPKNIGFAGGVNVGIRRALEHDSEFVALMNNDAVADRQWLEGLTREIHTDERIGIVTAKILDKQGKTIDSTGEFYTIWGLAFARGRGEPADSRYDDHPNIFGASGGASIFRTKMFKDIGLFDDDFFAYYEDTDLSFRAQLRGWKVRFAPSAIVYHSIGATSSKIRGFTTYQTLKNLPLICYKDVPRQLLPFILPRLFLAYTLFFWSAIARGQGGAAIKGFGMSVFLTPKKLIERRNIQKRRVVSIPYIREAILSELPPGADRLQRLIHPLKYRQNRNTTL